MSSTLSVNAQQTSSITTGHSATRDIIQLGMAQQHLNHPHAILLSKSS
jgi:hypothetical protein